MPHRVEQMLAFAPLIPSCGADMRGLPLSRRALLGLLGATLMVALPIAAARAQALRIAVEGEYPPFSKTDKKGKMSGFDVDIANALCKALQAKCELVKQRWDRIIPDLVDGKYDLVVSSMSITAERRQKIDFTNPYYYTPAKFVAKENADLAATLDALKGRKIAVQKATTHEQQLVRKLGSSAQIVRYETMPKAQADLAAGKVDLVFGDALALWQGFLQTDKGKGFAFVGPDFIFGAGIGIGVRKGQTDLVTNLNRALDAIRADGTYDKIAGQYFTFPLLPVVTQ
jgi:arginine/ornithine transport system substrate-binding protein